MGMLHITIKMTVLPIKGNNTEKPEEEALMKANNNRNHLGGA